ncbi:hypothetical protein B0H14DRAFT_3512336 [Mycena olivaceomarginata]|nr:hypothetical protein B0H14DRAFT_3512336 [Mycena olivaceomarginata]
MWTPPTAREAPAAEPDADTEMPGLDEIPDGDEPTQRAEEPEASVDTPATPNPNESTAKSDKEEEGPKIHKEPPGFDGDRVLSNAIFFLMEFGRRVFEILKIFIFTFAGSSNQNYMRYMLDPPELKAVLLNNWLINLLGEIGKFIEGDSCRSGTIGGSRKFGDRVEEIMTINSIGRRSPPIVRRVPRELGGSQHPGYKMED